MNSALVLHPAYSELRQLIAQLSLISHISGTSYDAKIAHDTTDDIGGRHPPGSDQEYKPRPPPKPREPPEDADDDEWRIYDQDLAGWKIEMEAHDDEVALWRVCYQRRTAAHFTHKLESCETVERLIRLRDQARESLAAWQRCPLPSGQDPEYGSPQWKRFIAESPLDGGTLARQFGVTRQYIHTIRKGYRAAA